MANAADGVDNGVSSPAEWRPSASLAMLQHRARLLKVTRDFFDARGVLEVDTPALVNAGVTDINLRPIHVPLDRNTRFLHTSPEYAMKRLLAAGSGDIYQLCHVFRGEELSRLHNTEFMLLEWYRLGVSMPSLIEEVMDLLDTYAQALGHPPRPRVQVRYRDLMRERLGHDPLHIALPDLRELACAHGLDRQSAATLSRDDLLDFLVGTVLGPTLASGQWLALTHYPASQAALAALDTEDPDVSLRFEIYADGVELANGFVELADATEQRQRFEHDNLARRAAGLAEYALDERLLAALAAGIPACAGVAVGFDRAFMVCSGASAMKEVMSFTTERA